MAQLQLNTLIANNAPSSGFFSETFTITPSNKNVTLSHFATTANIIVSCGGLVLQPSSGYSISNHGYTLLINESILESTLLEVRYLRPAEMMGQNVFTTPGTYSWTAPDGVTSVSVLAVGGGGAGQISRGYSTGTMLTAGGGGGGGLGWIVDYSVTPGNSYTVVVGEGGQGGYSVNQTTGRVNGGAGNNSYFISTATVAGYGGQGGRTGTASGGSYYGNGGGIGGSGYYSSSWDAGGGGGAAGYFGNGGNGGQLSGTAGQGGGGGGGSSDEYYFYGGSINSGGDGGGVGIKGAGESGAGGVTTQEDYGVQGILYISEDGYPGSGGSGRTYGGGGAGYAMSYYGSNRYGIDGGQGAVVIRWGAKANVTIGR